MDARNAFYHAASKGGLSLDTAETAGSLIPLMRGAGVQKEPPGRGVPETLLVVLGNVPKNWDVSSGLAAVE
jgi:hypothetical protein